MRDMNGVELKADDKVVYEYHGDSQNGLQLGRVVDVSDYWVKVKRKFPDHTVYGPGQEYGQVVTLSRREGILRITS